MVSIITFKKFLLVPILLVSYTPLISGYFLRPSFQWPVNFSKGEIIIKYVVSDIFYWTITDDERDIFDANMKRITEEYKKIGIILENIPSHKLPFMYAESLYNDTTICSKHDDTNFVLIDSGEKGCSSAIGMSRGCQRMELNSCFQDARKISHEFLHSLGFYHIHQRPNRDNFLLVPEYSENTSQYLSKKEWEQNCKKIPSEAIDVMSRDEFDSESVMLFEENSLCNYKFKNETKLQQETYKRYLNRDKKEILSKHDIIKVHHFYRLFNNEEYVGQKIPFNTETSEDYLEQKKDLDMLVLILIVLGTFSLSFGVGFWLLTRKSKTKSLNTDPSVTYDTDSNTQFLKVDLK